MADIFSANGSSDGCYDKSDFKELFRKFGMAEGIIGMVCNTLAWLVILRTKNLLHTTNYLLAYLAVIDSLSCFFMFFYNATHKIFHQSTLTWREFYCRLIYNAFSQTVTTSVSSYTLCVVTYERYIGIVHPLHYQQMISNKKVTVIVLITWLISLLISILRLFALSASDETNNTPCYRNPHGQELEYTATVLFIFFSYLLPILFMSWAYYKIQATLKRNAHQLKQQNVQAAGNELLRARQKVVNMLMIVMGAIIVCWFPFFLQKILCVWKWCDSETAYKLSRSLTLLYYMNSVINPIIYVFKYKKFRKGLQDMICCCISRAPRPNRIGVEIAMDKHNT